MSTQPIDEASRVFEIVDLLEDRIGELEKQVEAKFKRILDQLRANNLQVYSLRNSLRKPRVKPLELSSPNARPYNGELEHIVHCVCREFAQVPQDVLGKSRWASLVTPRHTIMYLAREKGLPLADIGRALRAHHTSVMNAIKHVEKLKADAVFSERLERIQKALNR